MGIVNQIIKEYVPKMSRGEKEYLLESLAALIDRELIDGLTEDDRTACPHCGCPHTVKKGRSGTHQRYLCKGCARTFCSSTNRILALSKLDRGIWVDYARCMIDGLTLRRSAERCGVGLKTSFYMRIRICECIAGFLEAFRVGTGCAAEIDEYYLHESFKGNHAKNPAFTMPRRPKRRPSDNLKGGISKENICILTGINDRGAVFLEMAGRSTLSNAQALELLSGKILEGAIVSTDWHPGYKTVMSELKVAVHNRYPSRYRKGGVINAINSLHARLSFFLASFKGVSTRRLHHYLSWFSWLESFRLRNHDEHVTLAAGQIANGYYRMRLKDCWQAPYPFGDYWGLAY